MSVTPPRLGVSAVKICLMSESANKPGKGFLGWLGRQVGYVKQAAKTDVTAPQPPAHQPTTVYREARVEERDHRAEMVDEDFEVRQPRGDAGEDQARHGATGLVGPAEDCPDFVFRFGLGAVVGHLAGAARMQQDRLAGFLDHLVERKEFRPVNRPAVDVGAELHAMGAVLPQAQLVLLQIGEQVRRIVGN